MPRLRGKLQSMGAKDREDFVWTVSTFVLSSGLGEEARRGDLHPALIVHLHRGTLLRKLLSDRSGKPTEKTTAKKPRLVCRARRAQKQQFLTARRLFSERNKEHTLRRETNVRPHYTNKLVNEWMYTCTARKAQTLSETYAEIVLSLVLVSTDTDSRARKCVFVRDGRDRRRWCKRPRLSFFTLLTFFMSTNVTRHEAGSKKNDNNFSLRRPPFFFSLSLSD